MTRTPLLAALPEKIDVGNSVQKALDGFFAFLPDLVGFLVILVVGYVIAKIVKRIVVKLLQKAKLDDRLRSSHAGSMVDNVSPSGGVSSLIGAVVFYVIFLVALVAALGALNIPAVTVFINHVLDYLPNVVAAVLIFVVASLIATAVVGVVQRTMGDTPTGKVIETVVPGVVLAIAGFMILTQLQIAPQIVIITYTALIGMLALAGALAFGLGGRDVAAQLLQTAYDKSQDATQQAKQDVEVGKARGRVQVEQAKARVASKSAASQESPATSPRPPVRRRPNPPR